MNNINFLEQEKFPWSSDTFAFSQEMIELVSQMARIGGDSYILSGCEENGMNVSSGYIVINGEILPFEKGIKQPTIHIKEVRRDVDASGYHFPEVYRTRICEFGLGTPQYNWSSFKRIDTNLQLSAAIESFNNKIKGLQGIPKGVITMWSGSVNDIPEGWALCDGIQGRPNLAGRFIAGFNLNDTDYNQIGKIGGAKQVSLTAAQNGPHTHNFPGFAKSSGNWCGDGKDNNFDFVVRYHEETTRSSGTGNPHENRPPYYVLAYIIKL